MINFDVDFSECHSEKVVSFEVQRYIKYDYEM